jgi:N-acetylneuraminate synthase
VSAEFQIGDRVVGDGHPTYVIAEAGANHNRDMDVARRLIEVAAEAGADAVKFQTYSGNRIYSSKTPKFEYLEDLVADKSPAELLEEISLPRDWQAPLAEYAAEQGIHFFSSPFDDEAVQELDALDVPALKIASFESVDLGLIRAAAATGRPLIISTGMAVLGEVEDALNAAREAGATDIGLMQTTSIYPAPPELANLRAMDTMRRAFGVPVGLSDHTTGEAAPVAAVAVGAAIVEKHMTLSHDVATPDAPFSLDPDEFKRMVAAIRAAEEGLAGAELGPTPAEMESRKFRRSLFVVEDVAAGEPFSERNVRSIRPAAGLHTRHYEQVLGRRAARPIERGTPLAWDLVEGGEPA